MSTRPQLRGNRAAAAFVTLAFVAAPAVASAHQPEGDCAREAAERLAGSRELGELVAALDPAAPLPRALPDSQKAHPARQALETRYRGQVLEVLQALGTADIVARSPDLHRALRAKLRHIARARLDFGRVEKRVRAAAWDFDVAYDLDRAVADDFTWHLEILDVHEEPAEPWETVADAIIAAALVPARVGIVVRHLVGAAAKLTPRVARALL